MRNSIGLLLVAALNAPLMAESLTPNEQPAKSAAEINVSPKSKTIKSTTNSLTEYSFEDGNMPNGWENDGWEFTSEFSTDGSYSIKTTTGTAVWNATFAEGYLNFDVKSIGNNSYIKIGAYSVGARLYNEDWRTYSADVFEGATSISFENDPFYGSTDTSVLYIDNVIYIAKGQDNDNDGIEDQWEFENGLNYKDDSDANLDPDEDGLTNLQEFQLGTIPDYYDSDGDDVNDSQDSEPLNPQVQ